MHFSLTDLRLFVLIAECASLSKAARQSNLSLPAVSKRVHALEDQAGCRLLERDSRGVRLTVAGDTFFRHARTILLEAATLREALGGYAGGLKGHLIVLANTTAVTEFMPKVLASYLAANPLVSVSLREEANNDIARGVREGRADLGVVAGEVDLGGLDATHIATDRLVLVAHGGHPLARRPSVAFSEVVEVPMVGMVEGSTLQAFLSARIDAMGYPRVLPRVQLKSFEGICLMAQAGVGVAVVPESAARRYAEDMHIVLVPLEDAWAVRKRYVVTRDRVGAPPYLCRLVRTICEMAESYGTRAVHTVT